MASRGWILSIDYYETRKVEGEDTKNLEILPIAVPILQIHLLVNWPFLCSPIASWTKNARSDGFSHTQLPNEPWTVRLL